MKIGVIGLGKIGLPVARNLIAAGHEVIGYRRSGTAELEDAGGLPGASPADVTARAELVLTCMPSADALDAVMQGDEGVITAAREGQVVIEIGSHPVLRKEAHIVPLKAKGADFLDGEVSGTPGMVTARSALIYLAGPKEACDRAGPAIDGFADKWMYLGDFGGATRTKLVNNVLVALDIAGTAQAMAMGMGMGLDPALLIPAVAEGSGSSVQFRIRAPWMADRKFTPQQGPAAALGYYVAEAKKAAEAAGVGTQVIDALIPLYAEATETTKDRDVAAIIELFEKKKG